ncbi:MAG: hypothetical protein ACKO5L_08535, partial [Bacteroidota bacterium]
MNKGILFSACLLFILSACHISKNVPKHQYLLKKVEVNLVDDGGYLSTSDLTGLLRQQPNQRVVGIPLRLMIFNAIDSSKVAEKRRRKNQKLAKINAKRIHKMEVINTRRIEKARSKGQEYYSQKIVALKDPSDPQRFLREWLKYKYGERPVVYDSTLYGISQSQLSIFLRKKGYYESNISPHFVKNESKQTISLAFDIKAGSPYLIDSLFKIGPDVVVNFYKAFLDDEQKKNSEHPVLGKPLDEDMLASQAEEVARFIRNFALFGFTSDNIRYEVDTNARTKRAKLTVRFLPRKIPHETIKDSLVVVPFVRYSVNRVFFHLSDSNSVEGAFSRYAAAKGKSNEGEKTERG